MVFNKKTLILKKKIDWKIGYNILKWYKDLKMIWIGYVVLQESDRPVQYDI